MDTVTIEAPDVAPATVPRELDAPSRGALFLDEHAPGWAWCVDPGTLYMGCAERCVLGQLAGSFLEGARLAGLWYDQLLALGFAGGCGLSDSDYDVWADWATSRWREEIARRRERPS